MAICIVDVDNHHSPTIQYGNMYRIDPTAYEKEPMDQSAVEGRGIYG